MAATGNSFETPHACPFVALELDRDKRSDKPDYRHRCFAEPTPAPRSIAHQEAFCLSPNFAGCPILQDWAVRAAARPTATGPAAPGAAAATNILATAAIASSGAHDDEAEPVIDAAPPPPAMPAPAMVTELPEDVSMTMEDAEIAAAAAAATGMAAGTVSPPTFATTWQDEEPESEQLGVFDAPPPVDEPQSSYGEPDAGYPEAPVMPAYVPPPAQQQQSSTSSAEQAAAASAVPAFLAGRSSRPPVPTSSETSSLPPPRPTPPPAREEIVPSWEIDGRYGAEMPLDGGGGGGGSRMDGILTAIAVIAILAIGVAAVLFLPGLLNRGSTTKTPAPSFVLPSGLPTVAPSIIASLAPTVAPSVAPSIEPTVHASVAPVGSPRLYRIKAGDSLARIANRFDTTIPAILAANPEITDPNNIFVGQIIVIPPPDTPVESAEP